MKKQLDSMKVYLNLKSDNAQNNNKITFDISLETEFSNVK